MRVSDFKTLFAYNYWARDKILTAASQIPPSQLTTPANLSHETILGVLKHTIETECGYRWGLQQSSSQEVVPCKKAFEMIEEFEDLPAIWREEQANMLAYLDRLEDRDLDAEFSFPNHDAQREVEGDPTRVWHHLLQVVNL